MIKPSFSSHSAGAMDPPDAPTVVVWQGELLWPTALPMAAIIDARAVTQYGVWVWEVLRQHPGVRIVADEQVRDTLLHAQVPVRWFCDLEQALAGPSTGVTASERSLLWE